MSSIFSTMSFLFGENEYGNGIYIIHFSNNVQGTLTINIWICISLLSMYFQIQTSMIYNL